MRQVVWAGLAAAAVLGSIGLLLALGSALVAGDWDLAPMPWIGLGMTLIVAGLTSGAIFGVLLVIVEPIGWWRLLAIPPALLVGAFWLYVLVFGLPTSGATEFDVATILYSVPQWLAILTAATVALPLPALVGRFRST